MILLLLEEAQKPLSWPEWLELPQSQIALVSAGIALVAALTGWASVAAAWRSGSIAKRSLQAAQEGLAINITAAADANKPLNTDFTNAIEIPRADGRSYVFDVIITNPSTRPKTVTAAPLTLLFADEAERSFDTKPIPVEAATKTAVLLPLELPAAGQYSGALAYYVSDDLLRGRLIRRFRIDVKDSNGQLSSIETIAVNRHG